MSKKVVISDVDGCLTDGRYIYTADGKVAKVFGPHDNDGVKLLKANGFDVVFISADKRGFPITHKRISDMKCQLHLVTESERVNWASAYIHENNYEFSVFFGDGINDVPVKDVVDVFVAPANARREAKDVANYVTESIGGQGAFLDLAKYIVELSMFR
jgi:3-deoxy-D-manno-octulosonate 8-phosphate phosphatase (KDO 8-P phosphatase)